MCDRREEAPSPPERETVSKEYRCYIRMKHRCTNPDYEGYERYGGRGIVVCDRWLLDYNAFLADVGRAPTAEHSLDRENNDGGYTCGTCPQCLKMGWPRNVRWVTDTVQANNRRTNRRLEFRGRNLTIAEWAAFLGCSRKKLWKRLKLEWPLDRVLTPWPAADTPAKAA